MSSYNESNIDCWLSRINKVESLCKIPNFKSFSRMEKVKNTYKTKMQSIFDRFYLDQINEFKTSESDELNHNKLRMYATLKGSFKREPYIDLVQSRNQRSWISRLRCSAHHLEIEKGRWNNVPLSDRVCSVCSSGEIGDEYHLVMKCSVFNLKRACFIGKMNSILPGFSNLTNLAKFKTMLCPTVPAACKVTNQFIRILFLARDKLAEGVNMAELSYPTLPVPSQLNDSMDVLSDVGDEWDNYSSDIDISFET